MCVVPIDVAQHIFGQNMKIHQFYCGLKEAYTFGLLLKLKNRPICRRKIAQSGHPAIE
jgi:hypothetical protein